MKRLNEEEIRELIQKVRQEGKEESTYILFIKEYKGKDGEIKITQLYGDFEMILMDVNDYDNDSREFTYAIIPKSEILVLLVTGYVRHNSQKQKHQTVYVFSYPVGWKSLTIN